MAAAKYSLLVPPELHEAVQRYAESKHVSLSDAVREFMSRGADAVAHETDPLLCPAELKLPLPEALRTRLERAAAASGVPAASLAQLCLGRYLGELLAAVIAPGEEETERSSSPADGTGTAIASAGDQATEAARPPKRKRAGQGHRRNGDEDHGRARSAQP